MLFKGPIMLINIPFSGFYNSVHDDEINSHVDHDFEGYDDLNRRIYEYCDFSAVFEAYAKAYCERFADEFKINLTFESLVSPKEYNFSTDRIFATIEESEIIRLFNEVDKTRLTDQAREMFTSRSGFMSFYDKDYQSWGDVTKWDHNQLLCLIQAFIDSDFDQMGELYLLEDKMCNGFLSELICEHTQDYNRLYEIYSYLEKRKNRALMPA